MSTFPVSDHCDGERFFNRYQPADRSLAEVARWMLTRQATPWPDRASVVSHEPPPVHVDPGRLAITFIGHSTFLIRTASTAILTDPVFTSHAGPFGLIGPRRVRPPAIAPDALPPIDLVLVSHNHYDHLQPSSLQLFRERAACVVPLGLRALLPPAGDLPPEGGSYERDSRSHERDPVASGFSRKIHELDWWQQKAAGATAITCVPAQHFSARTPWDRDRTLWCGFVVQIDGITLYFAGDTGYSPHFAEIGARFSSIDAALLPIGAYEPRWFMKPAHMNPEEAVRAHQDLHARVSIGMHFGTFNLTDEGIDEPVQALDRARTAAGVSPNAFRVLDFGESLIAGT